MQRDHVIQLHRVITGINRARREVILLALDHEGHQGALDRVRVDLGWCLGGEVRVGDVCENAEAGELGAGAGRADDDVNVGHLLEVRLGRKAVAKDADAAVRDGDRRSERGLHLQGSAAAVRCRGVCGLGVHGVDDEVHEDVVAQVRVNRPGEDVESERDIEGDELVRDFLRARAHG
eukprot:1358527-Rhodomonas_salina.3